MRREVGHLILARSVYRSVIAIHTAAVRGNDLEARAGLEALVAGIGPVVPELEALIAAQTQAAEAYDRTQTTLARFFVGQAEPQPDAPANDHFPASPDAPLIA